jgi:hypothetical protein
LAALLQILKKKKLERATQAVTLVSKLQAPVQARLPLELMNTSIAGHRMLVCLARLGIVVQRHTPSRAVGGMEKPPQLLVLALELVQPVSMQWIKKANPSRVSIRAVNPNLRTLRCLSAKLLHSHPGRKRETALRLLARREMSLTLVAMPLWLARLVQVLARMVRTNTRRVEQISLQLMELMDVKSLLGTAKTLLRLLARRETSLTLVAIQL